MSDDLYKYTKRDRHPERETDPLYTFTRGQYAERRDVSRVHGTTQGGPIGEVGLQSAGAVVLLAIAVPILTIMTGGAFLLALPILVMGAGRLR